MPDGIDRAWMRLVPRPGWRAWVEDEVTLVVWGRGKGAARRGALGLIALDSPTRLVERPTGSATDMRVAEELLSSLASATVDSTIIIPDRAIVLGVSTRTVMAFTGGTSYDCGIAGKGIVTLTVAPAALSR